MRIEIMQGVDVMKIKCFDANDVLVHTADVKNANPEYAKEVLTKVLGLTPSQVTIV